MSNNVAEYAAIIRVFEYMTPRSLGHMTVHGDSNLVINQLNGKWRIREGLYRSVALEAQDLIARLGSLGWQVDLSAQTAHYRRARKNKSLSVNNY
jgi:ribonuclease HI